MKRINKVYIMCIYQKTGGPESLHQLAASLRRQGVDAYICYFTKETECLYEKYSNYVKIANEPEDSNENIIIVPEIHIDVLKKYNYLKKVVCWLSWDFYEIYTLSYQSERWARKGIMPRVRKVLKPFYILLKKLLNMRYNPEPKELYNNEILHLYNCEYVLNKLLEKGITVKDRTIYYCGPIDESYIFVDKNAIISSKENIIAYNPKKANHVFIDRVIEAVNKIDSSVKFVRIENMTLEKVRENLCKAKVYMDFGCFPGPERIPREAVSLYCNLITSTLGAAENDIDVPIPKQFKFNTECEQFDMIAQTIIMLMKSYKENISQYDTYRKKVKEQFDDLDQEVIEIIKKQ